MPEPHWKKDGPSSDGGKDKEVLRVPAGRLHLMRMRTELLANGVLLLIVSVDNYVFRQVRVCTYSNGWRSFIVRFTYPYNS